MGKKKKPDFEIIEFPKQMLVGGTGLTLGSAAIEKMPDVPSKAGVQAGFTTFSGFMPTFGAIGGAGLTLKQLKKLDKQFKMKGGK
jgi:hypothetical protein